MVHISEHLVFQCRGNKEILISDKYVLIGQPVLLVKKCKYVVNIDDEIDVAGR